MTDVDIVVRESGATVRLEVSGALDASTVPAFVETLEPLLAEADAVVVDCARLDLCDSSGLGAFVEMRNALRPGATFALENPTPNLRQILHITDLTTLLTDPS
jgi:anti-anti-sigma factor